MSAPIDTVGAIEQLRLYFAPLATRQGILARKTLGQPAPADEALSRELRDRMLGEIRGDGGVNGGVVGTVWRAHELLDLGCATDHPVWIRLMDWLVDLQRRPGAFSQGCTPVRHSLRACEHFISGFFSPAPPEQRIAPVMFPNGKVFRAEPAARFAVSCLALRAVLRGGLSDRQQVERHTTSLLRLHPQWEVWSGYFAPDVIVAGIHALAFATGSHRRLISQVGKSIVAHQAEDGTWAQADLFHTIDALLAMGTTEARRSKGSACPADAATGRWQLRLDRATGTGAHRVAGVDLGGAGRIDCGGLTRSPESLCPISRSTRSPASARGPAAGRTPTDRRATSP